MLKPPFNEKQLSKKEMKTLANRQADLRLKRFLWGSGAALLMMWLGLILQQVSQVLELHALLKTQPQIVEISTKGIFLITLLTLVFISLGWLGLRKVSAPSEASKNQSKSLVSTPANILVFLAALLIFLFIDKTPEILLKSLTSVAYYECKEQSKGGYKTHYKITVFASSPQACEVHLREQQRLKSKV